MWELKFYARGGMGAVTAAKILVNAAILDGKFAQAIPSYGQERKGAPVYAFARLSDKEIEVKSYVYNPNCILVFETGLSDLGIDVYEGLRPDSVMALNTKTDINPSEIPSTLKTFATVDAENITAETVGDVPPNMAMLGALARVTGCVTIENLTRAIEQKIPGKAGERNAAACRRAYEEAVVHEAS